MAGVEFFFGRENIPSTYQLKINSYSNLESDYIYYSTVLLVVYYSTEVFVSHAAFAKK